MTNRPTDREHAPGKERIRGKHAKAENLYSDEDPVAVRSSYVGGRHVKKKAGIEAPDSFGEADAVIGKTDAITEKTEMIVFDEHAEASDEPSAAQHEVCEQPESDLKRKKDLRVAAIAVIAMLLVFVVVCLAVLSMLRTGGQNLRQTAVDILSADDAVTYNEGSTIEYNGRTYALNENMAAICIIGYGGYDYGVSEGRSGEADAVMVLALDTETGEATVIGIPRDSMVEVGEYVGSAFIGMDTMQLCLAYSFGDGEEVSCEYVTAIVQRILYNMPVTYYFAVDMDGVGPMANAIGGVSLTALSTIPNTGIYEGEPVVLKGDDALQYIRWRDKSQLDSSLDRQARQEQFIKTYASQALSTAKNDAGLLLELFELASSYSVTNLSADEFAYLASCLMLNGITSLDVTTLDGEMREENGYAAFYLDKTSVYETVLDVFYTQVDEEQEDQTKAE